MVRACGGGRVGSARWLEFVWFVWEKVICLVRFRGFFGRYILFRFGGYYGRREVLWVR